MKTCKILMGPVSDCAGNLRGEGEEITVDVATAELYERLGYLGGCRDVSEGSGEPEPTPSPSEVEPTPSPSEVEPTPSPSEVEPTPSPSEVEPTPSPSEEGSKRKRKVAAEVGG